MADINVVGSYWDQFKPLAKSLKKALDVAVVRVTLKLIQGDSEIQVTKFVTLCKQFILEEDYKDIELCSTPIGIRVYNFVLDIWETVTYHSIIGFSFKDPAKPSSYEEDPDLDLANFNKGYLKKILELCKPEERRQINSVLSDQGSINNLEGSLRSLYQLILLSRKELIPFDEIFNSRIINSVTVNDDLDITTKKLCVIFSCIPEQLLDLARCKRTMQKIITRRVEKEKESIDKEFEEYVKINPEMAVEEIGAIKNHLDELCSDLSLFDNTQTAWDIAYHGWPPILAPNPLVSFLDAK